MPYDYRALDAWLAAYTATPLDDIIAVFTAIETSPDPAVRAFAAWTTRRTIDFNELGRVLAHPRQPTHVRKLARALFDTDDELAFAIESLSPTRDASARVVAYVRARASTALESLDTRALLEGAGVTPRVVAMVLSRASPTLLAELVASGIGEETTSDVVSSTGPISRMRDTTGIAYLPDTEPVLSDELTREMMRDVLMEAPAPTTRIWVDANGYRAEDGASLRLFTLTNLDAPPELARFIDERMARAGAVMTPAGYDGYMQLSAPGIVMYEPATRLVAVASVTARDVMRRLLAHYESPAEVLQYLYEEYEQGDLPLWITAELEHASAGANDDDSSSDLEWLTDSLGQLNTARNDEPAPPARTRYDFESPAALAAALATLATVGNGVDVHESTLPNAGLGLFATRAFRAGDLITRYEGDIMPYDRTRAFASTSHDRSLQPLRTVIHGLTVPVPGRGGGSFANDTIDLTTARSWHITYLATPTHNVDFRTLKVYRRTAPMGRVPDNEIAVVLEATRDIAAGEELFLGYGDTYWVRYLERNDDGSDDSSSSDDDDDVSPPRQRRRQLLTQLRVSGGATSGAASLDVPTTLTTINGVRVLLIHTRLPGAIAHVQVDVATGDDYELPPYREAAHFIEHLVASLLRSRGYTRDDMKEYAEQLGISSNASTSATRTSYYMNGLLALLERMVAIQVGAIVDFVEFFGGAADPRFAREADAVIRELTAKLDEPDYVMYERLMQVLFGTHPRATSQATDVTSVRGMTPETVLAFFRRQYVPANMLITVASPLAADTVLALLTPLLARLSAATAGATTRPAFAGSFPTGRTIVHVPRADARTTQLMLVWPLLVRQFDDRVMALAALRFMLTDGFASRLLNRLRVVDGLVYTVRASFSLDEYDARMSYFGVSTSADGDKLSLVINHTLEELARFARDGPTSDEMTTYRNHMLDSKERRLLSHDPMYYVDEYVEQVLFRGRIVHTTDERYERALALTATDIRDECRRIMASRDTIVLYSSPAPLELSLEPVATTSVAPMVAVSAIDANAARTDPSGDAAALDRLNSFIEGLFPDRNEGAQLTVSPLSATDVAVIHAALNETDTHDVMRRAFMWANDENAFNTALDAALVYVEGSTLVERDSVLQSMRVSPAVPYAEAYLAYLMRELYSDENNTDNQVARWNNLLVRAAKNGSMQLVSEALAMPFVNPATRGNAALRRAAKYGHVGIVNQLLKIPTVITELRNDTEKMLQILTDAVDDNREAVLERLLKMTIFSTVAANFSYSFIRKTIVSNYPDIARLLLNIKAVQQEIGAHGMFSLGKTLLLEASVMNRLEITRLLLTIPAVSAVAYFSDNRLLRTAVNDQNTPMINLLLTVPSIVAHIDDSAEYFAALPPAFTRQFKRQKMTRAVLVPTTADPVEPEKRRRIAPMLVPFPTVLFKHVTRVFQPADVTALLAAYRVAEARVTLRGAKTRADGSLIERDGRYDIALVLDAPIRPSSDVTLAARGFLDADVELLPGVRSLVVTRATPAQGWHQDRPGVGARYATLIVALEDMDPTNGLTEFRVPGPPTAAGIIANYDKDREYPIVTVPLRANEGVLFDGRITHRGGAATSRRVPVVYLVYTRLINDDQP